MRRRDHVRLCAAVLALVAGAAWAAPGDEQDPFARPMAEGAWVDSPDDPKAVPAPSGPADPLRDAASELVIGAMQFIGVRYHRGGATEESGFDCSGFTRHIFERSLGLVLPRRADEQAVAPGLFAIGRNELQPGDLVFFNTLRRTFSHVGIYVGDGKFIHAPRPGRVVRLEDMRYAYWHQRFSGARRVLSPATASATPSKP